MDATGYPWYDDELMALRAAQRRWLYAIPRRDDGPAIPDLEITGVDAIAGERCWRELIDDLVSDEWRQELDRLVASQQAAGRIELHRRASDHRYPDSRVEEEFHHAAVEARRVAGRPAIHQDEYRGLLHLLDVAEALAGAVDRAVSR